MPEAVKGQQLVSNVIRIGILFESDEWSDYKLASELQAELDKRLGEDAHAAVVLVNMEGEDAIDQALTCNFLVSRVFASANFREHQASLARMNKLIKAAQQAGIPLLNPGHAHAFEVSKQSSTQALAEAGVCVPTVYACDLPAVLVSQTNAFSYPCIIKPDCSGRTNHTVIAHDAAEAHAFLETAPAVVFIAEEYIAPEQGFMTRIEIIDGKPELVVKRSIASNGLSSYHFGCTYAPYPDVSEELLSQATRAASALDFVFGSFDVIETDRGVFFIDANSVSNVSEDCTELLGMDLMARYAQVLANKVMERGR